MLSVPPPVEAWAPWRPEEIARRLEGVGVDWCVVGGWAVDLWRGEETRPHEDLEIAIRREDLSAVRRHLAGFPFYIAHEGKMIPLPEDEGPPLETHQNWVLDGAAGKWRVDVMLEPGDAETWIYRKDESIRAPRAWMVGHTREGIPHLNPAGVFLFKARNGRSKDERDFDGALPLMDRETKEWLRAALEKTQPGHPWIDRLTV